MNIGLMEQLAAPENLLSAWRAVRGNIPRYRRARSGGPDGVSVADFERDLAANLLALRDMLLAGRYRPHPPARFQVNKASGGKRQVVSLAVADRVAQRAAHQALEPLWEPEFLDCSFGFRPGLSLDDAVACADGLRRRGLGWVVDGDIAACFDNLDHDVLMARLRRKVDDGRVLALLQAWLDAGVMQAGLPSEAEMGLTAWARGGTQLLQRGVNWAVETALEEADPYAAARYDSPAPARLDGDGRLSASTGLWRVAGRRLAANGLLLGAAGARWAGGRLGSAAITTLGSPAGRRMLRGGALAAGGLAGLAAAAAVAALALHRRAGPAPTGALQGSPLSPLLANIYLHPFDHALTRRKHALVRYADDWVILCPDQAAAEAAFNDAVRALARLRLRVNPAKTRIVPPGEKLSWLGAVIA